LQKSESADQLAPSSARTIFIHAIAIDNERLRRESRLTNQNKSARREHVDEADMKFFGAADMCAGFGSCSDR
jgi:hypothetical protein